MTVTNLKVSVSYIMKISMLMNSIICLNAKVLRLFEKKLLLKYF